MKAPRSFSGSLAIALLAALVLGLVETTLIVTHRVTGVDPFHYVPGRIWLYVPLAWLAIAAIVAIPVCALWRRRGAGIALAILVAVFVGCRVAVSSRKWAVVVVVAVFLVLFWIMSRVPPPQPPRPRVWLSVLLVLMACGAIVLFERRPVSPAEKGAAEGPNVLVVFADTLRHDAVFLPDGTVRPELPALRRLAGDSTVYDRAYAASSWTLPSHFAAVTGLEAHQLGLDFDHQKFEKPVLTLAERFRRKGYRTSAVISNPFLNEASGFPRGFEAYEHAARVLDLCRTAPLVLLGQVWPRFAGTVCGWSASQVTGRALRHMNDGAAPWLVVLNYMEAHDPSYLEPECRAGAPRRHNTVLTLQVREAPLYHAAVRCLDRSLGNLFARAAASRRETVVVFTSDHGEHLHERGFMGHGQTLYPEVLHVPLIVQRPAGARTRVSDPVSLTQLVPLLTSPNLTIAPKPVVISTLAHSQKRARRREISVIRGPWQLITSEGGREELLDLRTGTAVLRSPLLPQLRIDTAAVQRAWPRLPDSDFRSIGYIQ